MSDDKQSYDISAACVKWWDHNLESQLKKKGCDQIEFSGGDSGSLSFHHSIPTSKGQFAFDYSFSDSSIEITCTDSPNILTYGEIFDYIEDMLPKCGC